MNPYQATAKQRSYFRALTGHSMPFKTSKTKASKMIEQAKAGTWKAPAKTVRVHGYQPFVTMLGNAESPAGNYDKLTFVIDVDYYQAHRGFETFEEALAVAKVKYPNDNIIEEPNTISHPYYD